ncbi:MAG: MFS transporter, partial [Carbonactinosporaceae bacterium]
DRHRAGPVDAQQRLDVRRERHVPFPVGVLLDPDLGDDRDAALLAGGALTLAGGAAVLAIGGVESPTQRRADTDGLPRPAAGPPLSRDRDILLLTLWGCMLVSGQYVLIAFLPVYLHEIGRTSLPAAVLFVAIAQVGAIAGRVLWGVSSDRLFSGRRRPLLLGITLVGCAAFVLLGVLPAGIPLAVFGVAAFLGGASVIGWQGIFVMSLGELAGPLRAGTATGFSLTFTSVSIAVAPPAYGLLADLTGGFQVMWITLAAGVGLALVPALLVREPADSS